LRLVRQQTPARLLTGRAGPSYRTRTQLELRADHAAAVDAVHADVDLVRDVGTDFVNQWNLLVVETTAATRQDYLLRPDLGRRLTEEAKATLHQHGLAGQDLQVAVGDGLSAAAVIKHVPPLLPLLMSGARERGWTLGRPFFIRHCRVGVLNDIGDVLRPTIVVLLIGERPGLATAESLSAYMAYRPAAGHTDAQRNLISNIHDRGVPPKEATRRILALAEAMRRLATSGVAVKEAGPDALPAPPVHALT
jgi:ethanolamine ammonia-lyase small subunit